MTQPKGICHAGPDGPAVVHGRINVDRVNTKAAGADLEIDDVYGLPELDDDEVNVSNFLSEASADEIKEIIKPVSDANRFYPDSYMPVFIQNWCDGSVMKDVCAMMLEPEFMAEVLQNAQDYEDESEEYGVNTYDLSYDAIDGHPGKGKVDGVYFAGAETDRIYHTIEPYRLHDFGWQGDDKMFQAECHVTIEDKLLDSIEEGLIVHGFSSNGERDYQTIYDHFDKNDGFEIFEYVDLSGEEDIMKSNSELINDAFSSAVQRCQDNGHTPEELSEAYDYAFDEYLRDEIAQAILMMPAGQYNNTFAASLEEGYGASMSGNFRDAMMYASNDYMRERVSDYVHASLKAVNDHLTQGE